MNTTKADEWHPQQRKELGSVRTLVYIAGFNYSGSTLLSLMLKEHSRIGTLGELYGPPHFAPDSAFQCSCGVEICRCPFFLRLEKLVNHPRFIPSAGIWRTGALSHTPRLRERFLYNSCPSQALMACRDMLRERLLFPLGVCHDLVEVNARLVEGASDLLGVDTIVDSSKVPAQVSILSRIPDLHLKVIHLVRHPGGCSYSAMRYHDYTAEYSARIWSRNYRTCLHQAAALPANDVLRVRYEDLCNNVEDTLKSICQFIGVSYEPQMRELRKTGSHVVGNRMRLASDTAIRVDETWRMKLSREQIAEIEDTCAREMIECGYT